MVSESHQIKVTGGLLSVLGLLGLKSADELKTKVLSCDGFLGAWKEYRHEYLLRPAISTDGNESIRGARETDAGEVLERVLEELDLGLASTFANDGASPPNKSSYTPLDHDIRLYFSLMAALTKSRRIFEGMNRFSHRRYESLVALIALCEHLKDELVPVRDRSMIAYIDDISVASNRKHERESDLTMQRVTKVARPESSFQGNEAFNQYMSSLSSLNRSLAQLADQTAADVRKPKAAQSGSILG